MKKQIAILGIILLLVCVGLSGCTNSDNDGGSADTITPTGNYDIDYRGIKIYVHSLAWNDWLDESDWERFASWKCNCIYLETHWTYRYYEPGTQSPAMMGYECYEDQVGYYEEEALKKLDYAVEQVQAHGFFCWIGICTQWDPDTYTAWQWSNNPDTDGDGEANICVGSDYINWNLPDKGGGHGRERFGDFLVMMTDRYPDCGFTIWAFPYHHQSDNGDAADEDQLYNVTLPYLIDRVRENHPTMPLQIDSLKQGLKVVDGWQVPTGQFTVIPYWDDPYLYYGWDTHDGSRMPTTSNWGAIARSNTEWDGDMTNFMRCWQPMIDFSIAHPEAKFMANEYIGLCVHDSYCSGCGNRPITPSRISWLRAIWNQTLALNASWVYHIYTSPGIAESLLDLDGSENEIAYWLEYYNELGSE